MKSKRGTVLCPLLEQQWGETQTSRGELSHDVDSDLDGWPSSALLPSGFYTLMVKYQLMKYPSLLYAYLPLSNFVKIFLLLSLPSFTNKLQTDLYTHLSAKRTLKKLLRIPITRWLSSFSDLICLSFFTSLVTAHQRSFLKGHAHEFSVSVLLSCYFSHLHTWLFHLCYVWAFVFLTLLRCWPSVLACDFPSTGSSWAIWSKLRSSVLNICIFLLYLLLHFTLIVSISFRLMIWPLVELAVMTWIMFPQKKLKS